ncbi:murein DD-endopeptidase MepM/ murein hydrolase activator NlpD [Pseudochelatococcus lubricantis]|uniref:Murein DD-endopeptidase MepM/ murein hydrolase activator NlpD n=1 Tax=Pseudochelatococcus lubricantis TaxID=1538102 RepID=A0ABX0V1G2_9HYPH|nr:M23 family metallopeptidase [Pseudochelatococcus lubricantis]NIJ58409.1 murein DD-endopeptidase MepM/ murein hydrolase activator NlpD [Pseudochelatococcus lubricantis]
MLQRTPVAFRVDAALRQPTTLAHRRFESASVDNVPPLDPSGIAIINRNRRRVSLRWLVGSVLTALSGGALIGGAIIIALQGEIAYVARPQRADVSSPGSESQSTVRKTDRLVRKEMTGSSARLAFKAPMTVRVGDREVIKTRDFVRISAPLSLTAGTYARSIPPFNPLNLFADSNNGPAAGRDIAPDAADVDVSVIKRPLAGIAFTPTSSALDAEEALAQIVAEERLTRSIGGNASQPDAARLMLFHSLRQAPVGPAPMAYATLVDAPFSDIDVRVIPENVTLLPKQAPALMSPLGERHGEERIAGRPGDTVLKVILGQGAQAETARAILAALELKERDRLREGQSLAILPALDVSANGSDSDSSAIGRVTLWDEGTIRAIAALTDDGRYVPVSLPQDEMAAAGNHSHDDSRIERVEGPGAPLYESLHETAARYEVPADLVREIVPLFASDVDFQRRVGTGESVELLYTTAEDGDEPELLYAALTVEGEKRRLFRFQSPGSETAFYDPEGRSLQKFLIRKPIAEGRLTSGFGMRYHPITNYAKMHTGVDWADRIGTPILAAGDGMVLKAGWSSGYGRRTEIQHANGYVSTYSHQSNFARGIQPGLRVRQGQVIGYLGNTGLSTGPHLHYEVMVNGRFVDPMKIKLPRSNELSGSELAEFSRQREQAEELLARAQTSIQTVATP